MPAPQDTAQPVEALPQSGGSYIREPDGALVQQKTKTTLADLVAAKQNTDQATNQPADQE
jgi:hypothetical protein